MIVTCPRCLTKYNLPEEKLASGARLNLHCSRCGWEFIFSPPSQNGDQESAGASDSVGLEDGGNVDAVVIKDVKGEDESVDASLPVVEDVAEDAPDEAGFEPPEDLSLKGQPDSQEKVSESVEKSGDGGDDQEIGDLALDLDALDLDEIEFDSFDDDPDTVGGLDEIQKESPKESLTQIDDDGDFDDLLRQVEDLPAETVVSTIKESSAEESGKRTVLEPPAESSASSQDRVRSSEVTDKRRSSVLVLSCFVVFSLALLAAYGLWQSFSIDMEKHLFLVDVENQRLRLSSERMVIVLRGKVLNSSSRMVTDLKIKGVLLDEAGLSVAEVVTAGGVSFSEEELDRLDDGKLVMLETGAVTLAPDGGELPFTIAFYDYPEKARECYVELSSFKVKKGPRP